MKNPQNKQRREASAAIGKGDKSQTGSLARLRAAFGEGGGLNREPNAAEWKRIIALSRRK
jgi:hypothetical protein